MNALATTKTFFPSIFSISLTLMMIKLTFESAIGAGARSHKHAQTKATAKR